MKATRRRERVPMCDDIKIVKVHQIEWHRNGVSGAGFYVMHFTAKTDLGGGHWVTSEFMATVFPYNPVYDSDFDEKESSPFYGLPADPHVAILTLRNGGEGPSPDFADGWRGDHFAPAVGRELARYQAKNYGRRSMDAWLKPFLAR